MSIFEKLDTHHHLYEKGFSRAELQARRPYRIAAAILGILTLLVGQLWKDGGSPIWGWMFGGFFAAAMYCALRASQRTSGSRTIRAAFAFLLGLVLIVWSYWGFTKFEGRFGVFTTPLMLVLAGAIGAVLLVIAARLSRSNRAA